MRLALVVSALALMSLSCATPSLSMDLPANITSEKVGKIQKGTTTRADLQKIFGDPEVKVNAPDGAGYFYKDMNLGSLWVQFNENWIVTDYEWSE